MIAISGYGATERHANCLRTRVSFTDGAGLSRRQVGTSNIATRVIDVASLAKAGVTSIGHSAGIGDDRAMFAGGRSRYRTHNLGRAADMGEVDPRIILASGKRDRYRAVLQGVATNVTGLRVNLRGVILPGIAARGLVFPMRVPVFGHPAVRAENIEVTVAVEVIPAISP